MKRLITTSLFILFLCGINAQEVTGSWWGMLKVGPQSLRLTFNIEKDANGYRATMDSPDQGVKGFRVSNVTYQDSEIELKLTSLNASYTGMLKDTVIEGTFMQNGMQFPLVLKKQVITRNRPQMPKSPFPYRNEEVTFSNTNANINLSGTLSIPNQEGKYPAVILISGSGPQNRDEEIMDHKPFLVLADYLTRKGIAVLRYDDRGTAASTGNFAAATTNDFKEDALAAFDFLKNRPEINAKQIGMIGHSEGGIISFMAAQEVPQIAFVVSLAGTALRGDSILLQQSKVLLEKQLPADQLTNYINTLREVFACMDGTIYLPADQKEQIFENKIIPLSSYQSLPVALQANLKVGFMKDTNWLSFLRSYNPQDAIRNTRCPILAMNGSKDMQVLMSNLDIIKRVANDGGNRNVTTIAFDGLNHLFQHCKTGHPQEYAEIEETISPEVLESIAEWVLKTTK